MFIVLLFSWTIKPKGLQVKTFQVIENEEEFGSVLEAPFDFIIKKPTFVTLLAKIPETNKKTFLYLTQVNTSYLEVYANETLVGLYGFSNKTAHIWYQPLLYMIPEGTNEIKLKIYGIYELGIEFIPYLIDESQKTRYLILEFLTNKSLLISIGVIFALSIILFMLSKNVNIKRKEAYTMFFLATTFGAIWLFDLVLSKAWEVFFLFLY